MLLIASKHFPFRSPLERPGTFLEFRYPPAPHSVLMLFNNVQKLTVLFVQELTDIMSLITLEKGKDASHSVGYYQ